jgi:hypothetical protein
MDGAFVGAPNSLSPPGSARMLVLAILMVLKLLIFKSPTELKRGR